MGSISYNTFINCEGDTKDKKIACLCTRLIDDIVFRINLEYDNKGGFYYGQEQGKQHGVGEGPSGF